MPASGSGFRHDRQPHPVSAGSGRRRPGRDPDRRLRAGDNTAIEELFQRHGERVHRILARTGAVSPSDLDDVVQAAFIAVQRGARRFDRRSAVGTWIVGIALNVARRHARGEARRRSAMFALAEAQTFHQGAGPDEQAATPWPIMTVAGFEKLPRDLRPYLRCAT